MSTMQATFMTQFGLSMMIVAPLVGAVGLLCSRGRVWSLLMSLLGAGTALFIGGFLLVTFRHAGGFEFSQQWIWISQWNVTYWVAMDGLSYSLLLMTLFLIPVLLYYDAESLETFRQRAFYLLLFETTLLGVYVALDLFLFLFFLELSTVCLFFYLGSKRSNAKVLLGSHFLLLNLIGSGLLLLVAVKLYQSGGETTHLGRLLQKPLAPNQQTLWCGLLILGLSIKGALIPCYAWFRDLEKRLDPGILIAVNGLYLPIAGYALIRFGIALLPYGFLNMRSLLFVLALLSLSLACLAAWGQRRPAAIMASVSLAISSWIFLGISAVNSDGLKGAVYMMGQHAWIMALIAMLLTLNAAQTPRSKRWVLVFSVLACLALMAFPGSGIFVSVILIGGALFREHPFWVSLGLIAFLSLGGLLFRERGLLLETIPTSSRRLRPGIGIIAAVLALLVLWGGVSPEFILRRMQPDSDAWLARLISAQEKHKDSP